MIKLSIPNMSCGHCRATIEEAVNGADPLAEISFDMEKREIAVESEIEPAELLDLLQEAGYPADAA